ncbi:small acid-soluble spore protein alpha/beta type [Natranaerovirga hydrolytica]|uniref:Small acid-soluble spore protein alpha/beta type n=1 Tax=Natranaerovirga hydrolytica TaxID=680378 RepID=A0A4R1MFT5_9FIRM|nr:alpha/beta-type small acid-soluble spore protein [Natranaerovirga hydrolytica]TCK90600.1 small acid-soluble spore protein alpha/beta type [Natranaerovirga hydrolytica]
MSYNNSSSSRTVVPQAKEALSKFKYEVASEIGVNLKQGYNGDLTSAQAGSVGGEMVKRMIASQEQAMANGQQQ